MDESLKDRWAKDVPGIPWALCLLSKILSAVPCSLCKVYSVIRLIKYSVAYSI
jgi:hypothetical protein